MLSGLVISGKFYFWNLQGSHNLILFCVLQIDNNSLPILKNLCLVNVAGEKGFFLEIDSITLTENKHEACQF